MTRPIEQLTLRELFTQTERLTRELIEHLEQGVLPKIQTLEQLVNEKDFDQVNDMTIRNQAASVLQADEYSRVLSHKMDEHLQGIELALRKRL